MQPAAAGLAAAYFVTGTTALTEGQLASALRDLQRADSLWTYWDRLLFSEINSKQRHLARLHLDVNLFTAYTLMGHIDQARSELSRAFSTAI